MNNYTRAVVDLFKKGDFDLITDHDGHKFEKQKEAFRLLTDHHTKELLLGGAAGGAKSFTAWTWLILSCLAYPGIHVFMARETLKSLITFGMMSFREVCTSIQLDQSFYKYNGQYNVITFCNGPDGSFNNGSEFHLLECKHRPSDPDMHFLGSSLFTFGAIEEGSQVSFKAYDVLTTRINRHLNDFYNLKAKLLTTANPSQGYLYRIFYLPNKNGTIADHMVYLPVLAMDNPFKDSGYMDQLNDIKDPVTRSRLRDGNWEYNDNPNALLTAKQIHCIGSNSHVIPDGRKFLTLDPAGKGTDTCIFIAWNDWQIIEFVELDVSTEAQIKSIVNRMRQTHQIAAPDVILDAIGIGHFLVDELGATGFTASEAAVESLVYENIKAEAGYKLQDHIHKIFINCEIAQVTQDEMFQELAQLQTWKSDDDKRRKIKPKPEIKKYINRSPGILDNFLMRSYAELDRGFSIGGVIH